MRASCLYSFILDGNLFKLFLFDSRSWRDDSMALIALEVISNLLIRYLLIRLKMS